MLRTTIRIRQHQLGLWFRHGDLYRVLDPGAHRAWRIPGVGGDSVEIVDLLESRFEHPLLRLLVDDPRLADRLTVVDLADTERALVWVDGRLDQVLTGGLHAFWASPRDVRIERFDVAEVRLVHDKLDTIAGLRGASSVLSAFRVEDHERALVYHDGVLREQHGAGFYAYWRGGATVQHRLVDLREQVLDIAGQEIMTNDKVTLRMNLLVTYRISDPVRALAEVNDYEQTLYREAQLELRSAIGTRPLDRLLADKDEVGNEIRNRLARRAEAFGVTVASVGLRDLILPGDMKGILNEVIVAQKQAEANLIRRREETAAARSQANTARLLAENPVLARMKELEALQEILAGTEATFILGSGDLADQLGSLVRSGQK